MKLSYVAMAIFSLLTISITACTSPAKKNEVVKTTEVKTSAPTPNDVITKPVAEVSHKVDKSAIVASEAVAGAITCIYGKDKRIIEIKTAGTGCELMYTKNGEAKSIATEKIGSAYCVGVSEKLTKNLSAAGFNCK